MASLLRQIVAGPRAPHAESNLDLCYVTPNIIATSGPSSTYPRRAYRNPTSSLVAFLDSKHKDNWSIFEFRAEGTGYPDSEVYGRIQHFPWPDHHPPPFGLVPGLMGSMRKWLTTGGEDGEGKGKVAVVHCKAGKGRSGSVATGYLICEEGWKREDALKRFTERRMRVGFGEGVSIPSQLRWVGYMDRWTSELGKRYVERRVEVVEIHVWGLRDGVKVAVEGFVEEGRKIQCFHVFRKDERILVDDGKGSGKEMKAVEGAAPVTATSTPTSASTSDASTPVISTPQSSTLAFNPGLTSTPTSSTLKSTRTSGTNTPPATISAAILRPSTPLILPTSDINIDLERRNRASYTGLTMVTSIAHVWFNTWFEGGCRGEDNGVFEIVWDEMDGIKGSKRKGVKALEKVSVVWRYVDEPGTGTGAGVEIREPRPDQSTHDLKAADWRGENQDQGQEGIEDTASSPSTTSLAPATSEPVHKTTSSESKTASAGVAITAGVIEAKHLVKRELGLRKVGDESRDVSRASSVREGEERHSEDSEEGVNEGAGADGSDIEVKSGPQVSIESKTKTKTYPISQTHTETETEPAVKPRAATEPASTDEEKIDPATIEDGTLGLARSTQIQTQTQTQTQPKSIEKPRANTEPASSNEEKVDPATDEDGTLGLGNLGLGKLAAVANAFLPVAVTGAGAGDGEAKKKEEEEEEGITSNMHVETKTETEAETEAEAVKGKEGNLS